MTKFLDTKNARFYGPDGTVRADADLRVAKKESLYVSVTSVLKTQPKPFLEAWKRGQLFEAVATMPRQPDWTDDYYTQLVLEESDRKMNDAAVWGTDFHGLVEDHCRGQSPDAGQYADYFNFYKIWHSENVTAIRGIEEVVVHKAMGYAGREDLRLGIKGREGDCLGDIKTRNVKDGKKPDFYPEQAMQLSAYRMCHPVNSRPTNFFSLIVNRLKPEPPWIKWWSEKEMDLADWRWNACLEHYRADKNWKWEVKV